MDQASQSAGTGAGNSASRSRRGSVTQVAAHDTGAPNVGSSAVIQTQYTKADIRTFTQKTEAIVDAMIADIRKTDVAASERMRKIVTKEWKEEVVQLLLDGILGNDEDKLAQFISRIIHDLAVPMPTTGALWSDPRIGQGKAKSALGTDGKVLADTPLGKGALKAKWAMQGANTGESAGDFAERNKIALRFWGAISAIYTEGLSGIVHVYLPKGITVGSIFWNDELPRLWELHHSGQVTDIQFHTQDDGGIWTGPLSIDDVTITDAYATDRTGVNAGALQLTEAPFPEHLRAEVLRNFQVKLKRPINVGNLRQGLQNWAERARRSNLSREDKAAEVIAGAIRRYVAAKK